MVVVDLEKGTEDAKSAPADAQLLAMVVSGGEKEIQNPDLRRPLPVKNMPDMEKGIKERTDNPAGQVPAVAEDEEQEHLIVKDLIHHQVEGDAVAGKMSPGQKWWLAYWLLAAASSVIILNNHIHAAAAASSVIILSNHIHAAPKDLFPPEVAMFIVFLCAICLMHRAMKQTM